MQFLRVKDKIFNLDKVMEIMMVPYSGSESPEYKCSIIVVTVDGAISIVGNFRSIGEAREQLNRIESALSKFHDICLG